MRYTARKILTLLVTMLVVSLLTFAAFDMISGDPAATLLGTQATPEKVEALRTEMGLNRPMLVRYGEWLAGFFTGNLGVSFQYRQPVQAFAGTARRTAGSPCSVSNHRAPAGQIVLGSAGHLPRARPRGRKWGR